MKKTITLIFLFVSVNLIAQDKITFNDGKTYEVKIVEDKGKEIRFYILSDSSRTIKKVPKEQILSYYKVSSSKITTNNPLNLSAGDELMLARDRKSVV